ncbi:MAG TPA: excinuclease ABC subunit UvrB [bacterium]|nr:excinuclease ABC subunit UvrB [bacterium]
MNFELASDYKPKGDQPKAIEELSRNLEQGQTSQTLLGVTGSGKTFTMAQVIQKVQRPALIISHNKTLAAQLYSEFKEFFPKNAVAYFVSYYDYYQPEAYLPTTDTFIEKDASINMELDRLRLEATALLQERRDVIIVASVSCIYGLGSPENYQKMHLVVREGQEVPRTDFLKGLVDIQYARNDIDFSRGKFRVKGDVIEIFPAYGENPFRIEFFGDEVEKISEIDPVTGKAINHRTVLAIYPAKHYVVPHNVLQGAVFNIREELRTRLQELKKADKLVEAQRLEQRTLYDLEMIEEMGYCTGIENYSRHFDGRQPGQPPYTLMDYFPKDYLTFIDESHATLPQLRAMFNGDHARKRNLVDYGFRLPCAFDNRPLRFEEFEKKTGQIIYVSATPSEYELKRSNGRVVEQIIRPTGLMDPEVEIRPAVTQVDDLIGEVRDRVKKQQRVLVTTLTKKMAEDLSNYLKQLNVKVAYLHSDVETLDRIRIIRDLRLGTYDVLVGVNLLREGLDLPEVSLVAILDADKEGFLRSEVSLMQTAGRAARNVEGKVLFYADKSTESIRKTVAETQRRRALQAEYNKAHGITPATVKKQIRELLTTVYEADYYTVPIAAESRDEVYLLPEAIPRKIVALEKEMVQFAQKYEYEKAAELRDQIRQLRERIKSPT